MADTGEQTEAAPTLASLRRGRIQGRRRPAPDAGATLFDLFAGAGPDNAASQETSDLPERRVQPAQPPSAQPPSPAPAVLDRSASPASSALHMATALPASPPAPSGVHSTPMPQNERRAEMPAQDAPQIWTVSGLVRHVRSMVEQGYSRVTVEGEISNWRPSGSGHCYFTVKDRDSQLSAVLFRRQASLLRFQPRDGDAVKLHGQLSIYENRGQMQLIVEWIQQAGLGALLAGVQRLKEQLRREGLFDRKRPLPAFPRCIGVITSLQGAALRDIVKVCRRRHAAVQLLIYPAAVQGPNCPAEIVAGLRWFNAHKEQAEVVLVARGGGSWEDLHGFDHENVARAIAACVLPVITGIGHATDSTIADAVADLCAPTPSAAAELLTAAQHRVEENLARLHGRLIRACRFELLRAQQRVANLGTANVLRPTERSLNRRAQRLDEMLYRLQSRLNQDLRTRVNRLRAAEARLSRLSPSVRLQQDRRRLDQLGTRLARVSNLRSLSAQRRLGAAHARLDALSPLRVLDRGYALLYNPDGNLLRDAAEVAVGTQLTARLAHGSLQAQVLATASASPSKDTDG